MRKQTRLCQKEKIYKGLQSPKYQEKLRNARLCNNDKSALYLPRQCLRDGAKALILLGFLDGNVEFTPLEDRIGIIEKIKK